MSSMTVGRLVGVWLGRLMKPVSWCHALISISTPADLARGPDQAPAASTTVGALMLPAAVRTPITRPFLTSTASTGVAPRYVAPSRRAEASRVLHTLVGSA